MTSPGYLHELNEEGERAWSRRVRATVEDAIADFGDGTTALRPTLCADDSVLAPVEWTGFPERLGSCLGRGKALELLDAPAGIAGGRSMQEEYVEWRVVRNASTIRRIELTTELAAYWQVLAAHEPEKLLALVAQLADEETVSAADVFGREDALGDHVTAADREMAFANCMLGNGASPYNDGSRAICCMRHQSNTLSAAAQLATVAAIPRAVRDNGDGHTRAPICSESTRFFEIGLAQLGRASDPLILERLAQLAYEGREIAFDSPVGLYMGKVEPDRLVAPDGAAVPLDWFRFGRGAVGADGKERFQRLTFELPIDADFALTDLIDLATERPLRYGGELADLVGVSLFFGVSREALKKTPAAVDLPTARKTDNCKGLPSVFADFERARPR